MIVDCHTHIWQAPEQLGQALLGEPASMVKGMNRLGGDGLNLWRSIPPGDPDHHWAQNTTVDVSIVLGFKSRYLRAEIPNRFIADYVRRSPGKLVGFAGIDPTDRTAVDELRSAKVLMGLKGMTISPSNQDFHPADSRAMRLYAEAERLKMPVLIHPCSAYSRASRLDYAQPLHFDEVARSFPEVTFVISQMGYPFVDQTMLLLSKHPKVYADISGLPARPWIAYNTLLNAYQAGVFSKLLFGSDFPYTNATECIEALFSLNTLTQGTSLPMIPREAIRSIVERNALPLLGLDAAAVPPSAQKATSEK
jgi:uncharacterized protein